MVDIKFYICKKRNFVSILFKKKTKHCQHADEGVQMSSYSACIDPIYKAKSPAGTGLLFQQCP